MTYTGRCACNAVTLTITGEALSVRQCWCRQCQQIAAGGPTHNVMFKAEDVTLSGTLGTHAYLAPSGHMLTQYFCPSCGAAVGSQSAARMHFMNIRLGMFDVPHDLKPRAVIWTSEAPAWAMLDPALEHFERQPPPPVPKD
jgi:hypothetical protein